LITLGYGIVNALGTASGAHDFSFEVIDAGLRLDEALAMGLPTEEFHPHKELPHGLKLSALERKMFTGTLKYHTNDSGKKSRQWINCERVELNAIAVYPDRFIGWVERKLDQHGANRKLIPDKKTILKTAKQQYNDYLHDTIHRELLSLLCVAERTKQIAREFGKPKFNELTQSLAQWATELPTESWRRCCEVEAQGQVIESYDRLIQIINHHIPTE
jgi:hypothetical protein